MAGKQAGNPATHFGRQMRKERMARGWSLAELGRRTGINMGHLSRIENGKRPPTEALALTCDSVFPERKGWFLEYYEESRSWTPPWFRSWPEYEDKATSLRDWSPSIVTGLLQTEEYARALLATLPGVDDETVASRLASRMERQRRVLLRDEPPAAWFIVDEPSLHRLVGTPAVMAAQLRHLLSVATQPNVTMQVLAAVGHPATQSGFVVADAAALCEHVTTGFVYTDQETVSSLLRLFDSLRSECFRASESATLLEGIADELTQVE